jgi:putative restriction endonuclease
MARYWWVNQNQTYNEESGGGYLWSPKRNKNGSRSRFYDNMREVSPGDQIFSYRNTAIAAVSNATSYCYESPQPEEFGAVGSRWERAGWRVDAAYTSMPKLVLPRDHMVELAPLLPEKYSPLKPDGMGNQMYLAEISESMADVLFRLLTEADNHLPQPSWSLPAADDKAAQQSYLADDIAVKAIYGSDLTETEKESLVKSRRGQGQFRQRVLDQEKRCRITGVVDAEFLIASHIKPWRESSNHERIDGENGLLLTPTIDRLFDRGFISFEDSGELIVSPVLTAATARVLGLPAQRPYATGTFTTGQKVYLQYHRDYILKRKH